MTDLRLFTFLKSGLNAVRGWRLLAALAVLATAAAPAAAPDGAARAVGRPALQDDSAGLTLQVDGTLVPQQSLALAAALGGRAGQVFVQEGQFVTAGTVLVELDSYPQLLAEVDAAALEAALARRELKALNRGAAVELAETGAALARAEREQAFAGDNYASLIRPKPQELIDQARANLKLAENRLERAREDLAKTQKYYTNKNHMLWKFMNARQFKLRIAQQEGHIAELERLVNDAGEKVADLQAPPDPVDLEVAAARLETANTRVDRLLRRQVELAGGPDPDALELAEAQVRSAEAGLAAAQAALRQAQIVAPVAGLAVAVDVKAGEWMPAGEARITLADLEHWEVETDEVEEHEVTALQVGQPVALRIPALDELSLEGRIASVDLTPRIDEGDAFYGVKITLEGFDPRLRWGMTAEVLVEEGGPQIEADK